MVLPQRPVSSTSTIPLRYPKPLVTESTVDIRRTRSSTLTISHGLLDPSVTDARILVFRHLVHRDFAAAVY